MKSIAVYCGSHPGSDPEFMKIANQVGIALAERGLRLVYGGGKAGLMGAIAKACMLAGGEVLGIIPKALLEAERAYLEITELQVVADMHERKYAMINSADAFIALPGGIGTLEELFEVFTWNQLGLLEKPCGVLNVNGYYDHLLSFLNNSVQQGFLKKQHFEILQIESNIEMLLVLLANYERKHPTRIAEYMYKTAN